MSLNIEDLATTFGGALSARVAAIYSPSSRTTVKYIFGKAFRAPNAYEEYYVDGLTIAAAPKALRPEQILSHELVFERTLVSWLSLTAEGYYDRLEKFIDQEPDGNSGLTYFVNDGRVHAQGLEFELKAARRSGIQARASYTLSRTRDDVLRSALDNSPTNQAKLNTSLPISRRAFGALELLYVSALEDYRETRVSPYLLTNITHSSRPLWGGWEFSASCYNALDRRFASPMGPNDPEASIPQDGRVARFKVSYRLTEISKRSRK